MAESALTVSRVPRNYTELRRRIETALLGGQQEIEATRVRAYWQTGRLLDQYLLVHQDRARYGDHVIRRLAADAGIATTVLYRCVRFARAFPIVAARPQLTWAHYRALTYVEDDQQRSTLALQAAQNAWTSRELEDRLRPMFSAESPVDPNARAADQGLKPLVPKRGTVGVYRLTTIGASLAVDLGFTSYLRLTPRQSGDRNAGQLVRLRPSDTILAAPAATPADLYTYPAEILRVIDGDTLWLNIHLRPRYWLKEKLRLRGLDCPETDTAPGRAARDFVQALAHQATAVTITTTKPDKWDRYLSDIFLDLRAGDSVYLNNALLDHGHATRKTTYTLADWERTTDLRKG